LQSILESIHLKDGKLNKAIRGKCQFSAIPGT